MRKGFNIKIKLYVAQVLNRHYIYIYIYMFHSVFYTASQFVKRKICNGNARKTFHTLDCEAMAVLLVFKSNLYANPQYMDLGWLAGAARAACFHATPQLGLQRLPCLHAKKRISFFFFWQAGAEGSLSPVTNHKQRSFFTSIFFGKYFQLSFFFLVLFTIFLNVINNNSMAFIYTCRNLT